MTRQTLGWAWALGRADLDVSKTWITAVQGISLSRRGCHLVLAGGCRDLLWECEGGVNHAGDTRLALGLLTALPVRPAASA